jgi:hypothetical protein
LSRVSAHLREKFHDFAFAGRDAEKRQRHRLIAAYAGFIAIPTFSSVRQVACQMIMAPDVRESAR